jgi:hypothetical protein
MTRQLIQALGAGLLLALFASPSNAQFSRSVDRGGGETGRAAVAREGTSGGDTRSASERRDSDAPQASRARGSEPRQETVSGRGRERGEANPQRPASVEPARPASGGQHRASSESRRSGPESRGRRHDDDGDDGWRDDDWRHGRRDNVDKNPGGIVINPILVRGVTVAGQSISPPTLIGRRVVIGQTTIDPHLNIGSHPRKLRKSYPSSVVYLAPGIAYETEPADDEIYVDYDPEAADVETALPEPVAAMPAVPSLASLGSYFSFTPWYALTDRITAGYPVAYPDRFVVSYEQVGLRPGTPVGNPGELPPAAVMALEAGLQIVPYAPGTFGGLRFQVEPQDAEVYIDEVFVGLLEDYPADGAPLPLSAGTHRVELRATGYRVETFDVIVVRGQVTPLSGLLLRLAR